MKSKIKAVRICLNRTIGLHNWGSTQTKDRSPCLLINLDVTERHWGDWEKKKKATVGNWRYFSVKMDF